MFFLLNLLYFFFFSFENNETKENLTFCSCFFVFFFFFTLFFSSFLSSALKKMILGATRKLDGRDPSQGSDLIRMLATKVDSSKEEENNSLFVVPDGRGAGANFGDEVMVGGHSRGSSRVKSGGGSHVRSGSISSVGSVERRMSYDEMATDNERQSMRRIYEHTRRMSELVVEEEHELEGGQEEKKKKKKDDDDDDDDDDDNDNDDVDDSVGVLPGAGSSRRSTVQMAESLPLPMNGGSDSIKEVAELKAKVFELEKKLGEEAKQTNNKKKMQEEREKEESQALQEEKKKYYIVMKKLGAAKEYEDRVRIELAGRDSKLKEITSTLRMSILQAKSAIRQQHKMAKAVHAQEQAHVQAIQQLHERHTMSIDQAAEKEKLLKNQIESTADISNGELITLQEELTTTRDLLESTNRSHQLAKTLNEEKQQELSELRQHTKRVESERTARGQELKDLHIQHISETSRLESTLSITRSELETMDTNKSSRVERLEAALSSSEYVVKTMKEDHVVEMERQRVEMGNIHEESIQSQEMLLEEETERVRRECKQKIHQLEQESSTSIDA